MDTFNYTRNEEPKKHRNSLKIEEKESYRWLLGYRAACKLAEQGMQVISIADRDIYECFAEATEGVADILVRSQHNRTLANEEVNNKLEKKLIRCPIIYEAKILLNRYRKDERHVTVAVRASKVLIKAPSNKKSQPPIEVNAVLVSEIDSRGQPLHWLLLTTLAIDSPEEIKSIVLWYSKRWCIEIFFKVLKSGCKIDTVRLQKGFRIENFIALAMIVAWRVMLYLPRQYPNEPCTCMFTEIEWKLAYKEVYNKPLPKKAPDLKEGAMLVAMLGGYQKRKDPPGIQTIWRGMTSALPH